MEKEMNIQNYDDFCRELLSAGFSLGGGKDEGVFALIEYSWDNEPSGSPVRWHTGDPEHDPWEWRIRVLDEREDIAYSKFFFRKSGYITREWYPCFLAARRGGRSFDEEYGDGVISNHCKRIYDLLRDGGALPLHAIKQMGAFSPEDKAKFDKALIDLQMKLYITMCGRQQKISAKGEEYGWSSTVFCTTESFWVGEVFERAAALKPDEAGAAIADQIYKLNPSADPKKIRKFILG